MPPPPLVRVWWEREDPDASCESVSGYDPGDEDQSP